MTRAEWIERMRDVPVVAVATRLGADVVEAPSSWTLGPCPACGAKKRHTKRRDRRGAVGIARKAPTGWRCHQCGETGDTLHFVALAVRDGKLGELDQDGSREVREWCETFLGLDGSREAYVPPAAPDPGPRYVDDDELVALWELARPVTDDEQVATWLERSRGIDPKRVALEDLARALPADAPRDALPAWAGFRSGRRWSEAGYRLLVPLYDHKGTAQSVIARRVRPGNASAPKGVSPAGYERSGLVMACALGLEVLEGCYLDALGPHPRIVITEGELDVLTWATEPDRGEPYATLGIFSGAWTPAIAARIPDGARLVLALDQDDEGDKYARAIVAPLAERLREGRVRAERWRCPS